MINEFVSHGLPHTARESECNIEPEMQSRSGLYPIPLAQAAYREILEPVMTQAFISQPIIGNIAPNDEQRERIHMLAERILSNAHRMVHLDNMGLDSFSRDIIVLATVLVLRNWNDEDANGNERLWEYICNQFALPFDYGSFGNSPVYKVFRESISLSLSRHKRLSATAGQRYYTSLLIHALAPKAKFYILFEQIFNFYAKNLHYHYWRNDPAFSAFAYAMKNRFGFNKTRHDDDMYIKSMQSSIAIKHYLCRCPEFMTRFVERIVRQMDALVATGIIGKPESDYVDELLVGWYEKRSREERTSDRRKRIEASAERVVTEFGNIRLSYVYEKGNVSLVIPSIRLGEERAEKPQAMIFRYAGDASPHIVDLRYYGNYICITSSKTEIPLELLMRGVDSQRFELRTVITYGGKAIFDSCIKLFREAIILCDNGTEILKRPENEYVSIFTQRNCIIEGIETSPDGFRQSSGSGVMYRILFDKNTQIAANGEPLFPVEQVVSGITLRLLVSPVSNCTYIEAQHEYQVFSRQPILEISADKPHIEKQYRLAIDSDITSFSDYYNVSSNSYRVPLSDKKGIHDFRIIDNATHKRVYELPYVVFKNFSLDFDGFYFTENYENNGALSVYTEYTENSSTNLPYVLDDDQNAMLLSYAEGDLAIEIPMLRCWLDGQEITEDVGQVLWHNDIPAHALLEIKVPRGYSATIVIGSATFTLDSVEIGNVIRAGHSSSIEAVSVVLRNESAQPNEIKLFDIAFEPYFLSEPLYIDDGTIQWSTEGNFIGDKNTEFEVHIQHSGNDYGAYKLRCVDDILDMHDALADGIYHYSIDFLHNG